MTSPARVSAPPVLARRFKAGAWGAPLALLALCALSYALLAGRLGFYWDDWPTIWYLHRSGPAGFLQVFAEDRPLLGWLFVVTTSLFGKSALAWQLFGVLTRWLSALALWGVLRRIWPNHPQQTAWAAALFAVYPGFGQQFIAVTYSHGWLTMAGFFFSLALMMDAVPLGRRTWPRFALSWLLAAYVMFADEYYFGLELLRPILLWVVLARAAGQAATGQDGSAAGQADQAPAGQALSPGAAPAGGVDRRAALERAKQVALLFSPYAVLMGAFLVWRLFIHESPRGTVQLMPGAETAAPGLGGLLITILGDLAETAGLAWAQIFNFSALSSFNLTQIALYAGVVMVVLVLCVLALARFQEQGRPDEGRAEQLQPSSARPTRMPPNWARPTWAVQAILLGVYALLICGWPFWMTGLPIELKFPWDRFTLPFMVGASLLLVGLIDLLARRRWIKIAVLGLVMAFSAGWHFQTAMHYRLDWNYQRLFFWQLTWRAPQIAPGTVLLTSELPFTYFTDNSLTAPLNWTYDPDGRAEEMAYLLMDVPVRLTTTLPSLQAGESIVHPYRSTTFTGTTSQALALFYKPPRCVKILAPVFDSGTPNRTEYMLDAMKLSDPAAWIQPAAPGSVPPLDVLGPEPPHEWCYYFQKAELARQLGDWEEIVALGEEGLPLSDRLLKDAAAELAPFIEGYARSGDWGTALELTTRSVEMQPKMRPLLCADWKRIVQAVSAPPEARQQAGKMLKCEGL